MQIIKRNKSTINGYLQEKEKQSTLDFLIKNSFDEFVLMLEFDTEKNFDLDYLFHKDAVENVETIIKTSLNEKLNTIVLHNRNKEYKIKATSYILFFDISQKNINIIVDRQKEIEKMFEMFKKDIAA